MAASTSITANLDPNHTGLTVAMSENLDELLHGQMSARAALHYLESISVGFTARLT